MAKKPPERPQALTSNEIQEAIEASGYPVEIELLRELREERIQSALGVRYEVAPREFKEIDVNAHFYPTVEDEENVDVTFTLLVEVKRLPIDTAFVGVMGHQMKGRAQLANRLRLTGSVTYDDVARLPEVEDLLSGEADPFHECMRPFHAMPQCAHWAIARRKKGGQGVFASGDEHYFEDFSTLVRAREMLAIEGERDRLRRPEPTGAVVGALSLALVVEAPCLHLYNPMQKTLLECPPCPSFRASTPRMVPDTPSSIA